MDSEQPPRRRRRAARRAAGPPTETGTQPVTPLAESPPATETTGDERAGGQGVASTAPAGTTTSHRPDPSPVGASSDPATPRASRRSGRSSREEATERSLRSLVTTRSSQVSTTAALRARELAMPSAADLAEAEADLVIVRRHYVPPTTFATGRRNDGAQRRGWDGQRNGRRAQD